MGMGAGHITFGAELLPPPDGARPDCLLEKGKGD